MMNLIIVGAMLLANLQGPVYSKSYNMYSVHYPMTNTTHYLVKGDAYINGKYYDVYTTYGVQKGISYLMYTWDENIVENYRKSGEDYLLEAADEYESMINCFKQDTPTCKISLSQ